MVEKAEDHILLVMNDLKLRKNLANFLSDYNTVEVELGKETLEKITSENPMLIVYWQGQDEEGIGDGFLKQLKQDKALKYIPVVMLIQSSKEMKNDILNPGEDEYILKPFSCDVVLMRVKRIIKMHGQEIDLRRLNKQLERKIFEQQQTIEKNERLT
ncbi:MAG: hypothetical protein GY765_41915, partial [bacterium]|nr:hypothetical protein [bacterium]